MLDARSPLPLYHQLAETLSEQIRSGAFAPGARIPSEHDLAKQYGLGRPTVRQATDVLIRSGVLMRKRGSGTFVRTEAAHIDLFSIGGTSLSFQERGIALETKLIDDPHVEAIDEPAHPLHGQRATRVVRVSSVAGQTILLEEIDFATSRFPGLQRLGLRGRSLSQVVQSRYRLRLEFAVQIFRVAPVDARRARLLHVPKGTQLLVVDRTLNFAGQPNSVFARMHCLTDRFVFSQRIGAEQHHA